MDLRLDRFSFTERALGVCLLTSAALLAGAHFFERIIGLAPCVLCLDQREAHWVGLGVAGAGLMAARVFRAELGAAAAIGACALVYAVSTGLAFYHTGVEYGFWPGPAICAGGEAIIDLDAITAALDQKAAEPACDEVQWQFLGVSMAGYNFLASAGLLALSFFAALTETRRARNGVRISANKPKEQP